MMNLFVQYRLFISSILVGVYLGVTYDLLFHFISSKLNKIIRFFIDILFFVIQAMVVFRFIYKINYAIIPMYSYFLFLIGYLIYRYFSNDYYTKRIEPLQNLMKKAFVIVKKGLYWGFVEPYVSIFQLFKKITTKLKSWVIKKQAKHKIKKKERKVRRKKKRELKKVKKAERQRLQKIKKAEKLKQKQLKNSNKLE